MSFRLVFTQRAEREWNALEPEVKRRISVALERYRQAPLQYARRMAGTELGDYRFRIGDYRVTFDLEGEDIVVLRVGHRRQIYRR